MIDLSLPAEQLLKGCLDKIGECAETKITAVYNQDAAEAAFEKIRYTLVLDAKNGRAEAEMQGLKVTESVAEAWVKTRPEYTAAKDAVAAAQLAALAAGMQYDIACKCLITALAVVNKDTKLALVQA